MRVQTYYNRVERIVYEFDAGDIQRALSEMAKVHYVPGWRIEFEIVDDIATLTRIFEGPKTVAEEEANDGSQ